MTSFASGLTVFFGLHALAMIALFVGVAFILIWAFKYLAEHDLWRWGWGLVAIGVIVGFLSMLFVAPAAGMMLRQSGMFSGGGYGFMPMMQWQNTAVDQTPGDDSSQAQEEAEGKALYDKLQAGELACADIEDSQFELIGEYVMGLKLGSAHLQMNAMMKQMMGPEGEEQMHILLARRATGCGLTGGSASLPVRGMMNGGMMRGWSSSAVTQ